MKTVLVIECTEHFNWYERFRGFKLHGKEEIKVEQAAFPDVSLTSYYQSGGKSNVVVNLRRAARPLKGTPQERDRTCSPDFILLRSITRGIEGQDSRNVLLGFIHANIPAVNTLQSAQLVMERPIMFGELRKIEERLGSKAFPLISQNYYVSHREMLFAPDPPFVAKIAHCHSGYGKMKITEQSQLADLRSIVAVHNDYATCEPFIAWDWDGRVQKIGDHYRCFRRTNTVWKGNTGHGIRVEDMELTPQIKRWADECSKAFGGLDILGLDFLHCKKTDKLYIVELNDTAIGLVHKHAEEDMDHIRDLVLSKMAEAYPDTETDEVNDRPQAAESAAGDQGSKKDKEEADASSSLSSEEEIAKLKSELSLVRSYLAKEKEINLQLQKKLNAEKDKGLLDRVFG